MRSMLAVAICTVLSLAGIPAGAHVPYIERHDLEPERPFLVRDPEQSKAVYAWLQDAQDVDAYMLWLTEPTRLFAQAIVPVCPGYEELRPSLAVIGPGLESSEGPVPFLVPDGYGAVIVSNGAPGEERPVLFEPFGGKEYYDAPAFDRVVAEPGRWWVVVFEPRGMTGDYVGVIGAEEIFRPADIVRSLVNTIAIRRDKELHTDC